MAAQKGNKALKEFLEKQKPEHLEGIAQASEAAERYEDMVEIMSKLVRDKIKSVEKLSPDCRNLLSVAYKNVVGVKRSAIRVFSDESHFQDVDPDIVATYKARVEKELDTICNEVLTMLKDLAHQNKTAHEADQEKAKGEGKVLEPTKVKEFAECQVFYLKMVGDYYRYLTEAFPDNADYKAECSGFYEKAMKIAAKDLEATHPTRLGLALNYSVCYYEILNKPKKACDLAKSAFDEAIEKLDSLNDVSYKDSTLIMQLLRDNLTIWNNGSGQPEEEPNKDAAPADPDN